MIATDGELGFWKTVAAVTIGVFVGGTLVLPTTIDALTAHSKSGVVNVLSSRPAHFVPGRQ